MHYLPALHRFDIKNIGVFKPIANDTASVKLIYVLIPFKSEEEWLKIDQKLLKDVAYVSAAERIFLQRLLIKLLMKEWNLFCWRHFPAQAAIVSANTKKAERVFELRSYESPTENLVGKENGHV